MDEAFAALALVVDAVHSPSVVAASYLRDHVWPPFWASWAHGATERDAALRVTSCVARVGAARRFAIEQLCL